MTHYAELASVFVGLADTLVAERGRPVSIVVCLSGRGDKDLATLMDRLVSPSKEHAS